LSWSFLCEPAFERLKFSYLIAQYALCSKVILNKKVKVKNIILIIQKMVKEFYYDVYLYKKAKNNLNFKLKKNG
jgi:hypothetical protein